LLQDQLLDKDIAAAARFLGYPELRALSIKGRANYACERRLGVVLAEGGAARIFPEDRQAHAVLQAAVRIRRDGELGALPAALLRRFPALRDLTRRSVAKRSEQCTREQCASERNCPFGRKRAALAKAHLLIANHDLLLRWPPDYPAFEHVIADEVHELADVADEVYALTVSAELVDERFEELFGRPAPRSGRRGGGALLPAGVVRKFDADARAWRRELRGELRALGRVLGERASDFGELEWVPALAHALPGAAPAAGRCADRLESIAATVEAELEPEDDDPRIQRALAEIREAGAGLRMAFDPDRDDAVAHFERLDPPFDTWRLVLRLVSTADPFHEQFLDRVHSFTGVSASLFIGDSAVASLGDLELEERAGERLQRASLPSPFPYEEHMRALALRDSVSLVEETAAILEDLALLLGGRTLGLFTSLRRMNQVAEELAPRLRPEGIDVLLPRRAADDPAALLTRFQKGAAVLLGARKFWQGLDIPGDALQAVVIEKLPFDVPSELRKRRETRLKRRGERAFEQMTLGRMLLHLKQMTGRLIRTEGDRGIAVLVEGRTDKGYFRKLDQGLPPGVRWQVGTRAELPELLREVGINPQIPRRLRDP
jgi:ATP-dependent DNA helicase DinG